MARSTQGREATVPTRGRRETSKRALLADVERALLDALAESPAMHRSLWKLQREGWVLRLFLDCERDAEDAPAESLAGSPEQRRRSSARETAAPVFRIDADDLRFLRSVGIDPTRKRRSRRRG
jgi:hypothetical protein